MGRKTIGLLGLIIAFGLAVLAGHLSAAPGDGTETAAVDAPTRPQLGDRIRIHLDKHKSGAAPLEGTLANSDEHMICIRAVVSEIVGRGHNLRTEKRETLQWISRHAIVYIERLAAEAPSTQPAATQPAAAAP